MMWVLITASWHILPLNILSGALWGLFSLASFNYLLQLTPADKRARYSAIFQLTVTVSFALGAALGSLIISWLGYFGVFIISGIGRLLAALLFARIARAEAPAAVQPAD
jgi:predicted MFS family arabinose efflux permease